MAIKVRNNAVSIIPTSVSSTATSITVTSGDGSLFPILGTGDYFYATIVSVTGAYEIVKVTARADNVMTVVRAQEGTSAISFPANSRFEHRLTAGTLDDFREEGDEASDITFVPYKNISATNVQAAIQEEVDDLEASTGAALIGFAPTVDVTSTNVQAAIAEIGTRFGAAYQNKYTGNGSTVVYTLSSTPVGENNTQVYIDGIYQSKDNYTVSGTTLTFSTAPPLNSEIEVIVFETTSIGETSADLVTYTPAGLGAVNTTVRTKLRETVSVKDFGAVGDGVTDDTAAIQAAIDTGASLVFPQGSYLCNDTLTFNQSFVSYYGENATLLFNGTNTERLATITGVKNIFSDLIFSGNNKQPSLGLVYVDDNSNGIKFINCTFKDILGTSYGTNQLNQTYGLVISPYGVADFEVNSCSFFDIKKYNDGSYDNSGPGPNGETAGIGFIGGIFFAPQDVDFSVAPTIFTTGKIFNCEFKNIQTILASGLSDSDVALYDDGDAIRTYREQNGSEALYVDISDCLFIGCSKRALKLRARGATVSNITVYGDSLPYGMVCVVDANNCDVRGVKFLTSLAKKAQYGFQIRPYQDANDRFSVFQDSYFSHVYTGINYFAVDTGTALSNIVFKNIQVDSCIRGVYQSSPAGTTQSNIVFDGLKITCTDNNAYGFAPALGADNSSGITLKNSEFINGDVYIDGSDITINNIKIKITNSSYDGRNSTTPLFRVGSNSLTKAYVSDVVIDATDISSTYLDSSRTQLLLLIQSESFYKNITLNVPDSISSTYPHIKIYGNDISVDNIQYKGASYIDVGTGVASNRISIRNVTRYGSGSCTQHLLYVSNASTSNVVFDGVTDFRPTSANTIKFNSGSNFAVMNVVSNCTTTIAQHGGSARTSNIVKFGDTSTFYTVNNLTTDRTIDCNSTTLDEVADVLGTLIEDLRDFGLIRDK